MIGTYLLFIIAPLAVLAIGWFAPWAFLALAMGLGSIVTLLGAVYLIAKLSGSQIEVRARPNDKLAYMPPLQNDFEHYSLREEAPPELFMLPENTDESIEQPRKAA
jgi:hypothetical protein